jgi:hypothetical protein
LLLKVAEMVGIGQNQYSENVHMISSYDGPNMEPPPPYKVDRDDTLAPRWWDVRAWSKKKLALVAAGLAIAIVVLIVIIVEVTKNNKYPDYSKLNYALTDTCAPPLFHIPFLCPC